MNHLIHQLQVSLLFKLLDLFKIDLEAPPITGSNLSAYLEDIVSDEEPLDEATPPQSKTPPPSSPVSKWAVESKTKEELLLMMETLDRDIATVEQQISLLEKQHQV